MTRLFIILLFLTSLTAGAQIKISQLPQAGPLSGGELLNVVQGGVSKKVTAQEIANLAPGQSYVAGYAISISGGVIKVDTVYVASKAWVQAYVTGQIAEIPAPAWTNITGKPTTFNPAAHTHALADVTGLTGALAAKQDALGYTAENAANKATSLSSPNNTTYPTTAAVKAAIDAIPSGGTSGGNADSLAKVQRISSQSSENHLGKVVNTQDSLIAIPMASGPNEFQMVYVGGGEYWFVRDVEVGTSVLKGNLENGFAAFFANQNSYANLQAGIFNTPFDSSLAANGDPVAEQAPNSKKYPSMLCDTVTGMKYLYVYKFSQGSFVQSGRWAKDFQSPSNTLYQDAELSKMNDIHAAWDPRGGVVILAKNLDMDGKYGIWRASNPMGPFKLQCMLQRGAIDSSMPGIQFTDPEVHFSGERMYIMYGGLIFKDTSITEGQIVRSSKFIQEVTNNRTGQIYLIGRPIGGFAGHWDGNPNFYEIGGKQYIWASRFSGTHGPNIDPTLVFPGQEGLLVIWELGEKISLPKNRNENNIVQIVGGNDREVVANFIIDRSGDITNTGGYFRAGSTASGMYGGINHIRAKGITIRGRIRVEQTPASGQEAYIASLTPRMPTLSPSAIRVVLNDANQIAIRYTYANGTSNTTPFSTVPFNTTFEFEWDGQTLFTPAGAVQAGLPNIPMSSESFGYFSFFNKRTYTIAPGNQFYGRIYNFEITKQPDPEQLSNNAASAFTMNPENRRLKIDDYNGLVSVTLPTATPSGYGYTTDGKGYYRITNADVGGSFIITNTGKTYASPGQTVLVEYTKAGGYVEIPSGTSGSSISGSVKQIVTATGTGGGVGSSRFTFDNTTAEAAINTDLSPARISLNGEFNSYPGFITSSSNQINVGDGTTPVLRVDFVNKKVTVGSGAGDASAALDIQSTVRGFLPPRMTAAQASAISSPAEGLMIYVTDTDGTFTAKGWWGFNGTTWTQL